MNDFSTLSEKIIKGIAKARAHVYKVGAPTPLQQISTPQVPVPVYIKREDLSPIKAYKWRGAFNAISNLNTEQRARGIVAASAGNHAQGVALACQYLECSAVIFMPTSTPNVKQNEVRRIGGKWVTIRLCGDNYDDASQIAIEYADTHGSSYVHPYNDVDVISGQGTLADEIVMSSEGPFDRVYVAIGGGGMASAVAVLLKFHWPDVEVIGVEGVDQASMQLAIQKGEPTELDYLDVFCDGTAVRKVGSNTFEICKNLLDRIITVTNEEVSQAVRTFWETSRAIPEPSGAMGLAAIIKDQQKNPFKDGEKPLTILCGANMDFAQISKIATQASLNSMEKLTFRIPVPDKKGALVELLNALPPLIGIGDMQYGYSQPDMQHPLITFVANENDHYKVISALNERFPNSELLTETQTTHYRLIEFNRSLLKHPEFLEVEFPERAGALKAFMEEVSPYANLFYFNYQYSGERVGRALLGVDYGNKQSKLKAESMMQSLIPKVIRSVKRINNTN